MKKGLLSILAASAVLVGCQNYDDQFDALNTQITALKTQVEGLAGVQATLTQLQGQLNSLQSAAITSADLDAALSAGLEEIEGQVNDIASDVENVASADDLESVSEALADAQEDIDELLEQGNVFSGDVIINSQSSLDAFHAIGSGLAIVNGNVTITAKQSMNQPKLQEVVNNIITITKDFKYTSEASTISETTFNTITGVQTMTIKQAGGIQANALVSAAKLVLDDTWKSKITIVDFRSLEQVETIVTGTSSNHVVDFNKATEIHLTALKRYGSNLTVKGAKNGVIMLTALRDVGVDGTQALLNLTISGPETFTVDQLDGKGGTLTVDTVGTLNVNSYDGTIVVKQKVGTVNIDNAVDLTGSTFADTENMTINGVKDPNNQPADKEGPSINLTTAIGDLANVTLSGDFKVINLSNHNSLANVTISADVTGAITLGSNSDLTEVDLTGSKATGVTIDDNDDLTDLTVDTEMRGTAAAPTTINGSVVVTNNEDLEELTVSSNKLETFTVTGNGSLETVDFTGVKTFGSAGKPNVTVHSNNIIATSAQDKTNATSCTDCGDGEANDLGGFVTTSGIATMKAYLNAVRGDSDTTANVYFDTIESILDSNGNETSSNKTYTSNESEVRILKLTPNTAAAAKPATTAKRSFIVPDGTTLTIEANNTTILSSTALSSNNAVAIATQILTSAATTAATAAGITMTATDGADPKAFVEVGLNSSAMENSATAASTGFAFNASDTLIISVEGYSATVTGTAYTTTDGLVNAWVAAWNAKYTTDALKRYDVATSTSGTKTRITFTARDRGTGSLNKPISASVSSGKTKTFTNVGLLIGNDQSITNSTADNVTKGDNIVLSFEAATAGSTLSQIGYFGKVQAAGVKNISLTGASIVELSSTYKKWSTASNVTTASNVYPHESRRNDVVIPEEGTPADPSNAVKYNRVHWL